ncbi:hypothetical protein [Halalkalibacter urbisdiaboli]|uniref:hypothetical protein n=1 Tax=Halalkalibacter urbisdiaboli TaxID=1960589 RepID=UPI000B4521A2|nr:hypothetical protein [Halalkalibacter urbisdiaboli]
MIHSFIYDSLSIDVKKQQINDIVKQVFKLDFAIFWGFDRGKMILNIYNDKMNNKLMFIRRKGHLELIWAKFSCEKIIDVLENVIHINTIRNEQQKFNNIAAKELQYQQIDYYLTELHYYMEKNNQVKINETKGILKNLLSSF